MADSIKERFHFGIYGVARYNGQVLIVHKNRGPYKGLYDLPGGKPEHGETIEETLKREFCEETGITIQSFSFFKNFSLLFSYTDREIGDVELHHLGVIYLIHHVNPAQHNPSVVLEDVNGSSWINEDLLIADKCSPLVIEGLKP